MAPDPTDAHLFAYFGSQWLHGHLPYMDIWDNKPPGIFAVNALVFLLFPRSFTALAGMEGLFILGCIGAVYFLMRQWGGPWLVASLSTVCVAAAANLLYYNERGNLTEMYVLWPATLSMYFFSKATPTFQGKWILLAGFFSGVASLFKPIGLAPLLAQEAFVFLLWAVFRRLSVQQLLASGFASSVGALAAWLPFAIYFGQHNALRELVEASLTYNLHYAAASRGSILSAPFNAVSNLPLLASLVVCVIVGVMFYVRRCAPSRPSRPPEETTGEALCFWWPLALLWVGFDFAGALAGGRGYPHYFLPLVVSLSVAAGLTYWFLLDGIPDGARQWGINKAIFALIVGPLIFAHVVDVRQSARWALVPSERPAREPWELIAAHLNTIRSPSDTLFTWDYMARIYFATDINSAMRLLDAHYIFDSARAHKRFGDEILRGLDWAPPTFIVDGWQWATKESLRAGDPVYRKFRELLEHDYVWIYTAGRFKVYRHQLNSKVVEE